MLHSTLGPSEVYEHRAVNMMIVRIGRALDGDVYVQYKIRYP